MNIFLSYAREDKSTVDQVYLALRQLGVHSWMDQPPEPYTHDGIKSGQDWEDVIRGMLKTADLVLTFFSRRSVEKAGFVQKEYRLALDALAQKPEGQVFLIPVLLEDCKPPAMTVDTVNYHRLQWFRLHEKSVGDLATYVREIIAVRKWATLKKGARLRALHTVTPVSKSSMLRSLRGGVGRRGDEVVNELGIPYGWKPEISGQDDDEDYNFSYDWNGPNVLYQLFLDRDRSNEVLSPVSGIIRFEVGWRSTVSEGQVVAEVESAEGKVSVEAPYSGIVMRFLANDSDEVKKSGPIMLLLHVGDEEFG